MNGKKRAMMMRKEQMYSPADLCRHSNSRRRRFNKVGWSGSDVPIAGALLAGNSAAAIEVAAGEQVGFGVAVNTLQSTRLAVVALGLRSLWASPRRQLPKDASEAAKLQGLSFPLATGGAGTI